MLNYLVNPIRVLLLVAALTFAVQLAEARAAGDQSQPVATARTTARTKNDANAPDPNTTPVTGILIIVGIVGGIILLAWICSRISDSSRPSMS